MKTENFLNEMKYENEGNESEKKVNKSAMKSQKQNKKVRKSGQEEK